MRYHAVNTAIM